ncbi:MAG: SgcJ/EcaC family oxidoreductase [Planctomycetaceae bacterium]|nr:SgcJ/EcaC family oxidoreductase [Planctomycetaceae bacterium]
MFVACSAALCQTVRADQATDEASIRKAVEAYVAAFNGGDSEKLAGMWLPDAVYTNPVSGEQVVGREAIEQQFASVFAASKGVKLAATTNSVQFISPGVAVENGTAKVIRPDQEPEETQYTAVYVKREGQWLLDRVTEEDVPVVKSNYEHLKDLEWMIGTWVDGDDQANVVTTCQWTKNRNFITRMFSLTVRDRIDVSGMQIVGWDPAAQQIRSWVFDSDGGFGEGTWSKKGKAWHVQNTGTAPDGSSSSSVNIITYVDDNNFTWQSVNRQAGGELLPNVDEVVVVRQETKE